MRDALCKPMPLTGLASANLLAASGALDAAMSDMSFETVAGLTVPSASHILSVGMVSSGYLTAGWHETAPLSATLHNDATSEPNRRQSAACEQPWARVAWAVRACVGAPQVARLRALAHAVRPTDAVQLGGGLVHVRGGHAQRLDGLHARHVEQRERIRELQREPHATLLLVRETHVVQPLDACRTSIE